MRRFIYTLLLSCITLTSCIIEHGEKPPKTQMARNVTFEVAITWSKSIIAADIAYKANLWYSATSQFEKYQIEDLFFYNYKLRIENDVITIPDLCKINTFGKSLLDEGVTWELKRYNIPEDEQSTLISHVSGDKFRIVNRNFVPEQFERFSNDLEIDFSTRPYKVRGSGSCNLRTAGSTKYVIKHPLFVEMDHQISAAYSCESDTDGVIEIEWQYNSDISENIYAEYRSQKVKITNKGVTDEYYTY